MVWRISYANGIAVLLFLVKLGTTHMLPHPVNLESQKLKCFCSAYHATFLQTEAKNLGQDLFLWA